MKKRLIYSIAHIGETTEGTRMQGGEEERALCGTVFAVWSVWRVTEGGKPNPKQVRLRRGPLRPRQRRGRSPAAKRSGICDLASRRGGQRGERGGRGSWRRAPWGRVFGAALGRHRGGRRRGHRTGRRSPRVARRTSNQGIGHLALPNYFVLANFLVIRAHWHS
jgi:hypothetical protein